MGLLRVSCCYYPKPNITLSLSGGVSLGGAVSVWCRGQHRGVRFVLNEERHHFPPVDSDRFEAVFPISNVRREDGGNYSCSYHSRSEPFTVSYPSEPVELVVRGEEPGSASPFPAPPPGRYRSMKFFLRKAGHPNPQVRPVPDGTVAEFPIPSVSREDGGNYTCDYHSITDLNRWSFPSDPIEIIVAGEGPGSVSGSQPHTLPDPQGVSVTIRCRGQHQGVRFVLNKERRHFPPVDSDGFEVVFPISNVRREHGGSYSCSYHSRSEPFAVSYPSDPVELVRWIPCVVGTCRVPFVPGAA
uniref:Immunoglobulin domain-containing protein n=1 Tax=Terrapene triunguis TaxID=2587831 RepID=A0A674J0S8_9SAUR